MPISRRRLAALLLPLALMAAPARAGAPEVYTGLLSNTAVDGYDVVAYFTEGRAVEGSAEHAAEYLGARWLFASAENRAAFLAEPARYAPQYGGHCSWAASEGYTAKGDPLQWTVVDGKLYLNYDAKVKADWSKDIPGRIAKGDANWPKLLAE